MENAERKKLIAEPESARPDAFSEDPWEAAYLRFETPEQEIQKFVKRLRKLGVGEWPRDTEIVELFCGRGNGLHASRLLGFTRVEGADLSARLVAQYRRRRKVPRLRLPADFRLPIRAGTFSLFRAVCTICNRCPTISNGPGANAPRASKGRKRRAC